MTDGPAIDQAGMKRLMALANGDAAFSASYQLHQPLGIGGSGVVFAAMQKGVERTVAVKFLVKLEEDDLLRFRREARLLAGLRHGHVVAIYELGELAQYPYLVTEFLPGGSLRDRMRADRLKLVDAVRVSLDSLAGLAACHEAGFVHRDVKPANILFDAEGRAKISDLGLARHDDDAGMTRTGSLVGTPRYMAPEQVRGERAGVGSDIYAMGLVMYEVLAGRQVFIAETLPALLHMQLEREPEPLETLAPGIPASLARAVHRALAKKVEDRHQTAAQLYDDIRRAAAEAALDVSHGSVALLDQLAVSRGMPLPPVPEPKPGPVTSGTMPKEPPAAALATGQTRARKTGLSPTAEVTDVRKPESATNQRRTRPLRSVDRGRRRISLALIVAVAMVSGLVSGVIVMILTRPSPGDRALAGAPQVRAGTTTVRFSWQTRVPEKSAVVVWPEASQPTEALTVTGGNGEKPGLDHAVVAGGLKPAAAYRFRLQYGDGSLSPDSYPFSTRADQDLIGAPTVRVISPTHARVSWKHKAQVTAGVRVANAKGDVYWPPPQLPDAVEVPIESGALNRLEIVFREFESPAPSVGAPERLPLPPVPGPAAARRALSRVLESLRENDIRNASRELLSIPYAVVPTMKRNQARPGDELVSKLTAAQLDQVIEKVRGAARSWLSRRVASALERGGSEPQPVVDLDVVLSSAASWLADAAHPSDEREQFRQSLMRLSSLDAAGQLTCGVDVLGIDEVLSSRVRVERRPGRLSNGAGESLVQALGLTSSLPLSIPVGEWGSQQISWMTTTLDSSSTLLDHVQAVMNKLSLAYDPKGPTRRWYRLAPLSSFHHPSAGLRLAVQVTNLDPSLSMTIRIGNRNLAIRNTLAAYTGYVDLKDIHGRDALERRASTIFLQVAPGVLSDRDHEVAFNVDAYTAENTQGTFATPPICWFHDISVQP